MRWIPTWARILDVPTNRHKQLLAGMRSTLERLKLTAEADHHRADVPPLPREEAQSWLRR